MARKSQLIQLVHELSEEDTERVLRFIQEMNAERKTEVEEYTPTKFWDNDDKIWNKMSR